MDKTVDLSTTSSQNPFVSFFLSSLANLLEKTASRPSRSVVHSGLAVGVIDQSH